ncbi:hypothetical protein MIMGU_mgv1a006392mg [Erythranthe guttata]|uniref:Peptidase S59 domain-containing protein n=1 Tax=Erythranthe guttata TaxID=4155 RepID=A0A022PX12_ERYGU|nr:hypothetical protein MIMGU_mgv1a006392mg [Erythranthe guttata]
MPIYQSKSHEELRLEDYELKQESNSYVGRFDMAATTSKSYVSPPFGSPCTQFASISGSNNGLFGASIPTIFGAPNTSGISFNSKPAAVGSESANGSNTNSIFGVSNAFAPLSASTGFTFPTTLQFGIKPTPPLWSTSASVVPSTSSSSTPTTVGFGVQSSSGGQTKPIFPFPPLSNPFIFQAATTPPLCSTSTSVVPSTSSFYGFGQTSAPENTSAFGVQRPADCFKTSSFDNIFHVPPLSNSPFHPKPCKDCEGKACPKASFRMNVNETELTDDSSVKDEDEDELLIKHEADVLDLMPKLPDGDYYTEPSLKDLAAKEISEPGYCSRVNDFVVGRKGYGSIKFLGETDIRNLDIESVIHFNNREVIVYPDSTKKPPAGQSLNKPAEVTLQNVKCISKKTGKEYVDGVEVESYKEMLVKKGSENGAEFVSYDPVLGEWKFRVLHF